MEYLVSTNLDILHNGNKPTFVISNRKEVIDLILETDKIGDLVTNWLTYRNPKRTNWEDLQVNLGVVPRVIDLVQDVELAIDTLQQAILSSYHQNCPARVALSPRRAPWWNKLLSYLKASTRQFFNQAKSTGDRESYKMALTCYNKEIKKPNSPLGGTTVRGSTMYLTGPDS
jgi:hypothetical protein